MSRVRPKYFDGDGVKDTGQLFDSHAEISDLRLLMDLVHVLDADGKLILFRQFNDGRIGLDQRLEDMVHEEAEVVAEMQDDVLGLELVCELHIVHQVLLHGLADGRFDLGGVDERRRMEAVLDSGLVPQLLDAADTRRDPFIQEIVRVVAAQFDPGKSVFLGEGKILLHRLRSGIKT